MADPGRSAFGIGRHRESIGCSMQFLDSLLRLVRRSEDADRIPADETAIDRKIRLTRLKLKKLTQEGKENESCQKKEFLKLRRKFENKQQELYRQGRKAQRFISLYDYAVLMRSSQLQSEGEQRSNLRSSQKVLVNFESLRKTDVKAEETRTLILRSQTIYESSVFLWQLMVASMLEVRLLKKAHILMMFHTQEKVFKSGMYGMVKDLSTYATSSDKLDEAFIDVLAEQEGILDRTDRRQKEVTELKEVYKELTKRQRRIILKFKLKEGQQVSTRSLARIKSWSNMADNTGRTGSLPTPPNSRELQELSRVEESDVTDKTEDSDFVSSGQQILLDFSLGGEGGQHPLLKKEKKEKRHRGKKKAKKGGRTDDDASVKSMPNTAVRKKKNKTKKKKGDTDDEGSVKSMPNTSARKKKEKPTVTDAEDANVETPGSASVPPQHKSTRSAMKSELVAIASSQTQLNTEASSPLEGRSTPRSELMERRKRAEQRLALSKQKSARTGLIDKRVRAKQRLAESKRRLQGFLSTSSDDDDSDELLAEESKQEGSDASSKNTQASPESVLQFPFFQGKKK